MNGRSADAKGKAAETLEIEDEEARQGRLRVCFFNTKLMATTQHFIIAENILQKLNTSAGYQQPKESKTFLDIEKKDVPRPEVTNQCMCIVCLWTTMDLRCRLYKCWPVCKRFCHR
jgi:hypothetical protein